MTFDENRTRSLVVPNGLGHLVQHALCTRQQAVAVGSEVHLFQNLNLLRGDLNQFPLRTALFRGGRRPPIYVGSDVTGDGRSDVLLIDSGGWLRLYRAGTGRTPRYDESKEFAVKVRDPRSVSIEDLDGGAGEEVILEYSRSLRILRYGR